MRNIYAYGLFLLLLTGKNALTQTAVYVSPAHKKLQTEGRIGHIPDGTAEIYWPGSSFRLRFSGSASVKAIMKDERGHNYFNVIIDDSLTKSIHLTPDKKIYELASGLSPGTHTVELSKRADWFRGKSVFYGFELEAAGTVIRVPPKRRRIEFYGNSITVGAAVEDLNGDHGDSTYTNNYRSYAAITARHFNAGYTCIASSGIGLMVSWGSLIMPDIYDRLNPDDPAAKWSFSENVPDVVVVNLLQNDQSLFQMPTNEQFKKRFGDSIPSAETVITRYETFIRRLRSHYEQAHIICALGSMGAVRPGSPWPGYIEKAVARINDSKIKTHFFAPIGGNKHPKIGEQQEMAETLIHFIEKEIKW